MDQLTIVEWLQLLRVIIDGVACTYMTWLFFRRTRDQWLYLALALYFGTKAIWAGGGVVDASIEDLLRPWHTIPALILLSVIVRDFVRARSRQAKELRSLEAEINRELQSGSVVGVSR